VRTFGFVAPYEAACRYAPDIEGVLGGRQVSRAGLIAQDLLTLGLTPAQVARVRQCSSITTFRSVREALGWMYVIERATLLQDGIRRHLLICLSEIQEACAYLTAFDGRVGDHWNDFGRMLEHASQGSETADEIIGAAHAGFACAQQWFRVGETRRTTG
jgi:heme oxygenase